MTKSNLKQVNKRVRTIAIESTGDLDTGPVPMYLDSTGTPEFVMLLPEFVAELLGTGVQVRASTADACERSYSAKLREWQTKVRTLKAEPVILVYLDYRGRDADDRYITSDRFGRGGRASTSAGVGYDLAFRVGEAIHERREVREDGRVTAFGGPANFEGDAGTRGWEPGPRKHPDDCIVLPYTAELHAQLDRIEATISMAANALHQLKGAGDPLAAIMTLAQRMLPAPTTEEGQ